MKTRSPRGRDRRRGGGVGSWQEERGAHDVAYLVIGAGFDGQRVCHEDRTYASGSAGPDVGFHVADHE